MQQRFLLQILLFAQHVLIFFVTVTQWQYKDTGTWAITHFLRPGYFAKFSISKVLTALCSKCVGQLNA